MGLPEGSRLGRNSVRLVLVRRAGLEPHLNRKEVNGVPRFPLDYSVPVCPASHMLSSDSKKRHCFLLALRTGCPGM